MVKKELDKKKYGAIVKTVINNTDIAKTARAMATIALIFLAVITFFMFCVWINVDTRISKLEFAAATTYSNVKIPSPENESGVVCKEVCDGAICGDISVEITRTGGNTMPCLDLPGCSNVNRRQVCTKTWISRPW